MTDILIKVSGASITCTVNGKITSGMVGLPVVIEYDESWAGLTKTAFFRVGGQVRKRDSIGTSTTVPWEILRTHGKTLDIGIEGRDADGNIVLPTVWCVVGRVHEGADGEIPAAPTPDNGEHPSSGGAVIDDNQISASTTWSSQKIAYEIASNGGEGGSYVLPIATPNTLGGVKPTLKTEEMTQSVGVDETGGLWTLPSGGGSGGGSSDVWELISSGTVSEEITTLGITIDNEGNTFRLTEAELKVVTAATETNTTETSAKIHINSNTAARGGFIYSIPRVFRTNAQNGLRCVMKCFHNYIWGHAISSAGSAPGMNDANKDEAITGAYISGGTFGVGSTWELWGVRK